jgi:hypothetical protein
MQNFHQNDKKSTKRAKFLNVTMWGDWTDHM